METKTSDRRVSRSSDNFRPCATSQGMGVHLKVLEFVEPWPRG